MLFKSCVKRVLIFSRKFCTSFQETMLKLCRLVLKRFVYVVPAAFMSEPKPVLKSQQVVVILGMHRSGTSLLTGTLQEAGLVLGDVVTSAPQSPPVVRHLSRR